MVCDVAVVMAAEYIRPGSLKAVADDPTARQWGSAGGGHAQRSGCTPWTICMCQVEYIRSGRVSVCLVRHFFRARWYKKFACMRPLWTWPLSDETAASGGGRACDETPPQCPPQCCRKRGAAASGGGRACIGFSVAGSIFFK